MHIAVSGYSGCGNTTTSKALAKKLDATLINFTFRDLAKEKGIEFETFRSLAEKDDSFDKELDRRQVEMALCAPSTVLASRLAIWMLKDADFKVFLDISLSERARRVWEREGGEYDFWFSHTQKRDDADNARYKKLYSIDNRDLKSGFDDKLFIIKDDKATPEKIVDMIICEMKNRRLL